MSDNYSIIKLADHTGFEPASNCFGGSCVTITPMIYTGRCGEIRTPIDGFGDREPSR